MPFRDLRVGAFLVPLAVSIVPISVVAWYGLVQIPAHENYLNERNLRLLMTLAGNIKTKVNNFDSAIDHAVQSYDVKDLPDLVHLFASDLDILQTVTATPPKAGDDADTEAAMLAAASDPPRIRIDRDEGRTYLYLGAKIKREGQSQRQGQNVWLVARTDIGKVVEPYISTRNEFDAVLVLTRDGDVIAQHSPIGLGLANIDSVLKARGDLRATDRNATATTFQSVRDFSNMMPLRVGGADYKLYMQPVPLSLLGEKGRSPDQWVVCGLVRADRFRAESSSLSFPMVLWFSAALAIVFLAIPFVKLHVVHPRERLDASDAAWVVSASFAAVGLLAVALLDVGVFVYAFPSKLDARLAKVSGMITSHLQKEVAAIDELAKKLDDKNKSDGAFSGVSAELAKKGAQSPTLRLVDSTDRDQKRVSCVPADACKTDLKQLGDEQLGDEKTYPYANFSAWIGKDGWQRVKWTPGAVITPFINIREEGLAYSEDLKRAWQTPVSADSPPRGVSVLQSPNTGEPVTVFWRVSGGGADDEKALGQSISTFSPIALDRPILPKGVSFVVVDPTGRALFHSDPTRSLQENFLKECEDNPSLRAAIAGGQATRMKAHYLGRFIHLHVSPVPLIPPDAVERMKNFKNPGWFLITFQDSVTADTINLETVTVACLLLMAYGSVLAVTSLLVCTFARAGWTKWFWPASGNDAAYRRAAWLNGGVAIGFVCLAPLLPPAWSWLLIIAIAPAVLFATRRIVVGSPSHEATRGFGPAHPFFLARAAFLLVLAGLPAIACFQLAYTFETKLLATSEHMQEAKDTDSRNTRIDQFVARFSLRDAATFQQFADYRRKRCWDSVIAPLWSESDHSCDRAVGVDAAPRLSSPRAPRSLLDPILAFLHQPYNDVAIDLRTAAAGADLNAGDASAADFWGVAALVVVLFGVCHVFVLFLVKPLFVMDAVAPGASSAANAPAASRLLTIGPPGSGKSLRLAAGTATAIFDVARLGYVDRRRKAGPVAVEQRRPVAATAGSSRWSGWSPFEPPGDVAPAPTPNAAVTWADAFDYSTLPAERNAALGIDHFDHRLEERDFAAQTLGFIERVVHRSSGAIRIACDRDPLVCLRGSGAPAAELERWARALASFQMEIVGVDNLRSLESHDVAERLAGNPSMLADEALDAYGVAVAPKYEALWRACTADEQLALYQLADEGLVNPQNQRLVQRLMRVGLIVRDPVPRVMTETFRRFVLQAASPEDISARERRGTAVPWGSIKAAMLTIVLGLAALLVVTQQQLVSAWVGFVPTLLPAAQRLWTVIASLRPKATGDHTA